MRMHSRYLESVEYRKKSFKLLMEDAAEADFSLKIRIYHAVSCYMKKRQERFMMICIMMHLRMTVLEQSRK